MEEPTVLEVKPDNIPDELKQGRCWIAWVRGEVRPDGTYQKIPVNPKTGRKASSTQPATWGTFKEAVEMLSRPCFATKIKGFKPDGIGRYPSDDFIWIDVDRKKHPDGINDPEIKAIVNEILSSA